MERWREPADQALRYTWWASLFLDPPFRAAQQPGHVSGTVERAGRRGWVTHGWVTPLGFGVKPCLTVFSLRWSGPGSVGGQRFGGLWRALRTCWRGWRLRCYASPVRRIGGS